MPINISNSKNRDAVVATEALNPKRDLRFTDAKGKPVMTRKLLKTDVSHDLPELLKKKKKLEKVADALIKEDPEIDIESFGMFASNSTARETCMTSGAIREKPSRWGPESTRPPIGRGANCRRSSIPCRRTRRCRFLIGVYPLFGSALPCRLKGRASARPSFQRWSLHPRQIPPP